MLFLSPLTRSSLLRERTGQPLQTTFHCMTDEQDPTGGPGTPETARHTMHGARTALICALRAVIDYVSGPASAGGGLGAIAYGMMVVFSGSQTPWRQ